MRRINSIAGDSEDGFGLTEYTALGVGSPHHAPVTAGAGITVTSQVVSLDDCILRSTGSGYYSHSATYAGLVAALAAASSGDSVELPPGTYVGDITVPTNVVLKSRGGNVTIQGALTLNSYSEIVDIVVSLTESSASAIYGIDNAGDSPAYLRHCTVSVSNTGAGDAVGVYASGAGGLYSMDCFIGATAASGAGYGASKGAGDIFVRDGELAGGTAPVGET